MHILYFILNILLYNVHNIYLKRKYILCTYSKPDFIKPNKNSYVAGNDKISLHPKYKVGFNKCSFVALHLRGRIIRVKRPFSRLKKKQPVS